MPSYMLRTFWGLDVLCEYRVRNIFTSDREKKCGVVFLKVCVPSQEM